MNMSALRAVKTKTGNIPKTDNKEINKTLKGVLLNTHLKNSAGADISFDEVKDSLLMHSAKIQTDEVQEESSFDTSKAIKPLLIGTALLAGGILAMSSILKKSSKTILNSKNFEQLPDLAVNMNIKEEPQFAIYRAVRDPNFKNILGAAGVFIMSGITLACKNFVDGAKEIWLKKQSADIEKELQENLIQVETKSFSGKLDVVNDMLNKNVKTFDRIINGKNNFGSGIFSDFISFKGSEKEKNTVDKKEKNIKNIKYGLLAAGVIAGLFAAGKLSLSNLKKTAKYSKDFADGYAEKTIDAINKISENAKKEDIPKITELFKSICAKPEYIKEVAKKYNLSESEISSLISSVLESKKTIFADAPTALGGIPKKIQYYCYIDENRGHLYNWILNPDNKFTKYIFMAFTLTSAIGYIFKQGMDAIKEVTILKENAKTELNLRKRLVSVEIENFKSKKESAVNPLMENFEKQAQSGKKTKEELKQLADNILLETKNGPPYVYN